MVNSRACVVVYVFCGCASMIVCFVAHEVVPRGASYKDACQMTNDIGPSDETGNGDIYVILLRTGNESERMEAAKRLGEEKAPKAAKALIDALDDPNQDVRSWAAWALGEIGDCSAIDPLLSALLKYTNMFKEDKLSLQTKCVPDIAVALRKLTHQEFGLDAQKWAEWRREQRLQR
jgi:hypothetical protein